jgi:hypothetical protein
VAFIPIRPVRISALVFYRHAQEGHVVHRHRKREWTLARRARERFGLDVD